MRPQTNRESCDAFQVNNSQEMIGRGAGAYYFSYNGTDIPCTIHIMTPGNHYAICPIDGSRGWVWNGDKDKPTIIPSILNSMQWSDGEKIELWHGFLIDGRLISC